MQITIKSRSGRVLLDKADLSQKVPTVEDVMDLLQTSFPKYYKDRQRLTFQNVPLERGNTLAKYNIPSGATLLFKDLGPQISWTTVFVIEYFGPIFIHPLLYFFPNIFYPGYAPQEKTLVQTITLVLVLLHFIKREYETLFVHRFSNATMPFRNLPKNCFHYWVLSGINLGYWVYIPGFKRGAWDVFQSFPSVFGEEGVSSNLTLLAVLVGVWMFAQYSNYVTHVILRNLRSPGSKERKIPRGYGFNLVSCPNYFFEVLGWACVTLITGSLSAYLFLIVGAVQMYAWAVKKHLRYKKEFGKDNVKGDEWILQEGETVLGPDQLQDARLVQTQLVFKVDALDTCFIKCLGPVPCTLVQTTTTTSIPDHYIEITDSTVISILHQGEQVVLSVQKITNEKTTMTEDEEEDEEQVGIKMRLQDYSMESDYIGSSDYEQRFHKPVPSIETRHVASPPPTYSKARTAYACYSQQQRPLVKKQHPEWSAARVTKYIKQEWEVLDEQKKEEYEAMIAHNSKKASSSHRLAIKKKPRRNPTSTLSSVSSLSFSSEEEEEISRIQKKPRRLEKSTRLSLASSQEEEEEEEWTPKERPRRSVKSRKKSQTAMSTTSEDEENIQQNKRRRHKISTTSDEEEEQVVVKKRPRRHVSTSQSPPAMKQVESASLLEDKMDTDLPQTSLVNDPLQIASDDAETTCDEQDPGLPSQESKSDKLSATKESFTSVKLPWDSD